MTSRRNVRRRGEPRRPRLSHWRADGQVKTRYASEQEANRAAFGYRLEHGSDLLAYVCSFCQGWHLGNQPEG
jgi:hypothetical protein